ncbi:MAG: Flp family type IVb pilin [Chloroflexi bacterium]|nr:Flp family type IVb pilin [Chloroflexota bacterium]
MLAPLREEEGQGLAEYGMIIAFVAAVCVIALATLSVAIAGALGSIAPSL